MTEYRTPEEDRAQLEDEARIRKVLDQAAADGGSLLVAMELGEPQDVVELWCDRVWNGLRDGLVDGRHPRPECPKQPREDRLNAIVLLLTDRMQAEADKALRAVREVGGE